MNDFPIGESWAVDALLSLGVAAAWVACWGFLRKRGPFAGLHYPAILAGTTGTALALAGLLGEGLTVRVGKLLLLDGLMLVSGVVLANALTRSMMRRATQGVRVPVRHRE